MPVGLAVGVVVGMGVGVVVTVAVGVAVGVTVEVGVGVGPSPSMRYSVPPGIRAFTGFYRGSEHARLIMVRLSGPRTTDNRYIDRLKHGPWRRSRAWPRRRLRSGSRRRSGRRRRTA